MLNKIALEQTKHNYSLFCYLVVFLFSCFIIYLANYLYIKKIIL